MSRTDRDAAKVPADLETICLKALEKDPDWRYQTVGEMADPPGTQVGTRLPLRLRGPVPNPGAKPRSRTSRQLGCFPWRPGAALDAAEKDVGSRFPLATVYDSAGRSVDRIDPLGARGTSVFDAAGQAVASMDALGRRSSAVSDAAARSVGCIHPLGNRTTTVHDKARPSIASVDPLSRRSTTVYGEAGRSVARSDALEKRTTSVYDDAGQGVAMADLLGRRTTTTCGHAERSINPH